ncbi:MAG: ATP synthase F1, gamma subunit [Candidatus Roizmanbacteria bacterium GW2011_GWA2_35_8]|uniref:ATP synthase gamma chain n=1 Tax=Candidatus Roizmanbacteria bacterium GW2011_GWA2_35_8 TaxID=1618479 RepID=A0A0G0CXU4_9BACT|nr:MAG: ATP synthase F1, gamma subunit [Candidatus Roizmanbacteria bacterium GW2011_GWA2_35_8]
MNIREVRKKIKSSTNVKKITKALEMVSAIKMRKAQSEAIEARIYQTNLEEIIKKVAAKADPKLSLLLQAQKDATDRTLSIVISTNKGLCGSYNFNLYRFILKNSLVKNSDFIVIGKKGGLFINSIGGQVIADFTDNQPLANVSAIFQMVIDGFTKKKYNKVNVYYNKFISTLKNEPIAETILPVTYQREESFIKEKIEEFLIEPDPRELINQLLNSYVEEKIRNCVIQAIAGEHSSRMIAMKNATENANDVIYNLTLLRNKIRQEKITYELLDMMTAKESVEN